MKINSIVDLTMLIHNEVLIYPGDPKPNIRSATTIHEDGYNTAYVGLGSHTGTHVDAPYHFILEGTTIENIDLTKFIGEGIVIDALNKNPKEAITLADIEPYEQEFQQNKIVLFHTGWSKYLGQELYFEHPFVNIQVLHYLLEKGIRTFLLMR